MGMAHRRDWNTGVQFVPDSEAQGTVAPSLPGKQSRTIKMFVIAVAAAATIMWAAFLCHLIVVLVGSLR
jgi:hypothetical protein